MTAVWVVVALVAWLVAVALALAFLRGCSRAERRLAQQDHDWLRQHNGASS